LHITRLMDVANNISVLRVSKKLNNLCHHSWVSLTLF